MLIVTTVKCSECDFSTWGSLSLRFTAVSCMKISCRLTYSNLLGTGTLGNLSNSNCWTQHVLRSISQQPAYCLYHWDSHAAVKAALSPTGLHSSWKCHQLWKVTIDIYMSATQLHISMLLHTSIPLYFWGKYIYVRANVTSYFAD